MLIKLRKNVAATDFIATHESRKAKENRHVKWSQPWPNWSAFVYQAEKFHFYFLDDLTSTKSESNKTANLHFKRRPYFSIAVAENHFGH